jgi:cell division protein FtsL
MNAAARLVHQNLLSRHLLLTHLFTRRQMTTMVLLAVVLSSALSVVYVTHYTRMLHAGHQQQMAERNQLYLQQGQLLLERSTWMMQARIQQVAESKLNMYVPDQQTVVVVRK